MGGGVGLSAHASHRLATERLGIAMPEVGIGFAPDVGGPLPARARAGRARHPPRPDRSDRIGCADALLCGLADRIVAVASVEQLVGSLREGDVDTAIASASAPADAAAPALAAARGWIDAAYSADTVEEILEQLLARPEPAARDAADTIATKSPTSLKVALRALRQARRLPTLEACLEQELRTSCAFLDAPDLVEGIRAAVIDKDRNPRWSPDRLEDVTPDADRSVRRPDEQRERRTHAR